MDEQSLKNINLEISLFRRDLQLFSKNVNAVANRQTLDLLTETISDIDEFIANAKFNQSNTSVDDEKEVDFLCNLIANDEQYECRRLITCRLCCLQIAATKKDFDAHIDSRFHQINEERSHSAALDLTTLQRCNLTLNNPQNLISLHSAISNQLENDSCDNDQKCNMNGNSKNRPIIGVNDIANAKVRSENEHPNLQILHTNSNATTNSNTTKSTSIDENVTELVQNTKIMKLISDHVRLADTNNKSGFCTRFKIIDLIKSQLNSFDSTVNVDVVAYGSRVYEAGTTTSDFNISIDMTKSTKSPYFIRELLKQLIKTELKEIFSDLTQTNTNRFLDIQLCATHIESAIRCSISVGNAFAVQSTKIIRDFMTLQPMCRYMVTYLHIWQETLQRKSEIPSFRFNSYVLSALVISLFQIRKLLPSMLSMKSVGGSLEISSTIENQADDTEKDLTIALRDISEYILDFFVFYGEIYKYKTHIISPHTGQLHFRTLATSSQRHFTPAELCLRDAMKSSPSHWIDRAMCVQDLVRSNINVTQDVSETEIAGFQKCCALFAKLVRQNRNAPNLAEVLIPRMANNKHLILRLLPIEEEVVVPNELDGVNAPVAEIVKSSK